MPSKPILPMTIERFFKLLSRAKKLNPYLNGLEQIRFNKGHECPLSAVYRVAVGKRIPVTLDALHEHLDFRGDSRRHFDSAVDLIVYAADDRGRTATHTRLRRRMLRTLGLKKRYER